MCGETRREERRGGRTGEEVLHEGFEGGDVGFGGVDSHNVINGFFGDSHTSSLDIYFELKYEAQRVNLLAYLHQHQRLFR